MVLISKACTEWCWSTHMCWEQDWYPLQSSKLQVKAEYTDSCPLAYWCSAILSFETRMLLCMLNYMCQGLCGLSVPPVVFQCRLQKLEFLQWHPSVGLFQLSFSSGIPVWVCFNQVFPVVFQCTLQVVAGSPSGIPVYTGSTSGIPVYTWTASVHWLRVRECSTGK